MKKLFLSLFTITVIVLTIQSCKKDPVTLTSTDVSSTVSTKKSKFKIYLTDAPGPFQEVNVDVQEVEIHSSGGGWQTLPILNPGIYNLLEYTNGLDTLILNDSLPVGTISQIRLILGSNNTIMVDSVVYPLSTPSAEQSGLKLQIHEKLEAGVTYAITLDFDVAKSVIKTGNGTYKLKPVIRTLVETVDVGGIDGVLVPGAITPMYAIMGTDTIGAMSNANGDFLIQGLLPGTYSLLIMPVSPLTDTTITSISVTGNQITNLGTINL